MEHSAASSNLEYHDLYRARRARILAALGDRAALVLAAAPELTVGRDTELRYSADPELFYLTGYTEPEAVAVFVPAFEKAPFTMFVRPRDAAREQWTGARGGPEAALSEFGAQAAFPISELVHTLPAMLADVDVIYLRLDESQPALERIVKHALKQGRGARARRGKGPHTISDPGQLLDEMRVVKHEYEIELLRQAASLTVAGFQDAIRSIRPGAGEWEIEAALENGFRSRGADGFAFPSIVASGSHTTTLHYVGNQGTLRAGELVLIDAGARYKSYCGDVSRTFPVSGHFSAAQRVVYDGVLRAHDAAIGQARPGASVDDLHEAALRAMLATLVELGLLAGKDVEDALADESSYKTFCPHRTSHWLGLDVHDVGAYILGERARALEPGMVLTVEPGLYIPETCPEAPLELRGTGVRIEDVILITEMGAEVLTSALPSRAEAIEELMRRVAP
jgi:Xaa-Pro aminopeptidase